jgi:hypothetical protein
MSLPPRARKSACRYKIRPSWPVTSTDCGDRRRNYWRRAELPCDPAIETVSVGCIGVRSNHLANSFRDCRVLEAHARRRSCVVIGFGLRYSRLR